MELAELAFPSFNEIYCSKAGSTSPLSLEPEDRGLSPACMGSSRGKELMLLLRGVDAAVGSMHEAGRPAYSSLCNGGHVR